MTEAAQSDGTSLLSTADAVDLLLQADAPPDEDTPAVSEEPPVVEEPADAAADEVEVQAEADEAQYEEVDEVDESDDEEEEEDAPGVEDQR